MRPPPLPRGVGPGARGVRATARRRLAGQPTTPAPDPRVARLQSRVTELEEQVRRQTRLRYEMAPTPTAGLGRPSWQAYVRRTRRQFAHVANLPDRDEVPQWRLPRKLENYRLALSHGIRVPAVYAVWDTLADIRLDDLPDRFVLKSDRGSTSRGVFPVQREGAGFVQVDGRRRFGPTGMVEELAALEEKGRARGPYFAEELLRDHAGAALPHDVKLYCFYGEVGQVLVRDVPEHGVDRTLRKRYVRPDGTDLTAEIPDPQDPSLPLPPHFEEVLRVGRLLSLAVPFPFVRVDLYDTPTGVVFGELTLAPGGPNAWSLDHDTVLGRMAEQAEARLWRDLALGRPYRILPGDHPAELVTGGRAPGDRA